MCFLQTECYVPNGTSCYMILSCDKVTDVEGQHEEVIWFSFKRLFEKLHKPLCKQIWITLIHICPIISSIIYEVLSLNALQISFDFTCILNTWLLKEKLIKLRFFKTSCCHPELKDNSNKNIFTEYIFSSRIIRLFVLIQLLEQFNLQGKKKKKKTLVRIGLLKIIYMQRTRFSI